MNALLNSMNDAALHEVMTDLGGHCFETVLNAFEQASQSDRRTRDVHNQGIWSSACWTSRQSWSVSSTNGGFVSNLWVFPKVRNGIKWRCKDVENVKLLKETSRLFSELTKYKVDKIDIKRSCKMSEAVRMS